MAKNFEKRIIKMEYLPSVILWVIPLGVDKKAHTVQMGRPITLNPANLGKITVTTEEKDGAVNHVKVWLANKEGHQIEEVVVDGENLRKNK